jgi:septum site-determining protein MinC
VPAGGDPIDWGGLIALLKKYRLNPVAVRNAPPKWLPTSPPTA